MPASGAIAIRMQLRYYHCRRAIGASSYGTRLVTTSRIHALSEAASAFVWTWLPGEIRPVPAGRLHGGTESRHDFGYLPDYLDRPNAIALGPDLPLAPGMRALPGLGLTGTLRDALPGAWGRRVTRTLQLGRRGAEVEADTIGGIGYGLLAGTDGVGALSYEASATSFEARPIAPVELYVLAEAVERVELGQPLPPELAGPLIHAVAVGGARPKALVEVNGRRCIAWFASVRDRGDMLRAEFMALQLARQCRIDVPHAELRQIGNRQVLLIKRFDRGNGEAARRGVISGRTLTGLNHQVPSVGWRDLADALPRLVTAHDRADAGHSGYSLAMLTTGRAASPSFGMVPTRNLPLPHFRDFHCASITKLHLGGLGAIQFPKEGSRRQARPRQCSAWTGKQPFQSSSKSATGLPNMTPPRCSSQIHSARLPTFG